MDTKIKTVEERLDFLEKQRDIFATSWYETTMMLVMALNEIAEIKDKLERTRL